MWGWLTGQSLTYSPQYTAATRSFSKQELQDLQAAYKQASAGQDGLSERAFLKLIGLHGLPEVLRSVLFSAAQPKAQSMLKEESFICFLVAIKEQRQNFMSLILMLLGVDAGGHVSVQDLTQALKACTTWACHYGDPSGFADALAAGAVQQAAQAADSETSTKAALTSDQLQAWLRLMPTITKTLQAALLSTIPAVLSMQSQSAPASATQLPALVLPKLTPREPHLSDCLLHQHWLWLISGWLPPEQVSTWELLFNSDMHGSSFSTCMGKVCNKGPTLILIRDKQGALFGGYALDAWAKNGQFYGAFGSFVFGLLPATTIWRPTGVNTNFLWCGQGFDALPNGLGFGGQVGYNALSIDSTLDRGMSRPSATFGNPCLAAQEVFEVDTVEVWETQRPEPNAAASGQGSALDRFKEDRNLLEMAGRSVQASRGYRDAPPEE